MSLCIPQRMGLLGILDNPNNNQRPSKMHSGIRCGQSIQSTTSSHCPNLSKNIDSLSATIDTISDDLIESSRDSKEYKDSMKSLSLKIKNINSKYESVVDILKS